MDEVECAECGNRYDSNEHPFCPRCGSVGHGPRSGDVRPQRFDPARRRAKAGGIILAVVGALALVQFTVAAIMPPPLDADQLAAYEGIDLLRDQPGGYLNLRILVHGMPAAANVTLQPATGPAITFQATPDGWANMSVATAFGNLTIVAGNTTASINYYVPAGMALTRDAELTEPPAWIAVEQLQAVRVIAGFLAFFGALVALGGVAAIRLRWWPVALAGAVIAVTPGLLLLVFVPLGGLLLAAPPAIALAFIAMGRRHFA